MTLKSIHVAVNGGAQKITLEGPNLDWGQPGQWKWKGFDRIKLQFTSGDVLVIEATQQPAIVKPRDIRTPEPLMFVDNTSYLSGTGATRTLRNGYALTIAFHWANPLTPAGAGIWFELVIGAVSGELRVMTTTRFHYAVQRRRDKPGWVSFSPKNEHSLDEFADREEIRLLSNKDVDELGRLLGGGTKQAESWLVDILQFDTLPQPPAYYLAKIDRTKRGEQQLAAKLFINADFHNMAPVSSRALGGAGDVVGRSLLAAGDLHLLCARHVHPDGKAVRRTDSWIVDWKDVPAATPSDERDVLSLPTLYRHIASHYPLGLAAARARGRFTTVPTRLEGSATDRVDLRFRVTGDLYGDASAVMLQQVVINPSGAPGGTELRHELGGAGSVDGQATRLAFAAEDAFFYRDDSDNPTSPESAWSLAEASGKRNPFALDCLSYALVPGSAAPVLTAADWLLGGVRTQAKRLTSAQFQFSLESRGELLERRPLGCEIMLEFAEGTLGAVGQDPEPGFEFLSAWLDRPRPISVDLSDPSSRVDLTFTLREFANDRQSRVLRLSADRTNGAGDFGSDVVVIDPAPLTIARVRDTLAFDGDLHVAEYSDDSEAPAGWEFRVGKGDMEIVLPPQAIGEEMIKGRLALPGTSPAVEVPVAGEPVQYRFSPNALLTVDRTDIDTARAPPPWMLRRLMARRTGVTGLKVESAELELVYGLTTSIAAGGLRVAELDALIGRVPFADAMVGLVRRGRTREPETLHLAAANGALDQLRIGYATQRAQWVLDLHHRPSWWPLFRSVGDRGLLKISEGVVVEQRETRNTAHPFRIADYANGKPQAGRDPLRGGVDWLFQSPGIYEEFLEKPKSVSAALEGVAFGPFGADGSQVASYANGKTVIISKTKQGHLESLVLMRIGRIARYWNQARHVIVYQRSTRRAPRYASGAPAYPGYDTYDEQRPDKEGFEGFMGLRKVREYVEVTQPRRQLDESRTGIPLAGPIRQSTFETTIMPVKANWARDVTQGQMISLWGPLSADEEHFFPRPRIFVEGARAPEKGGGLVANEADPSGYQFFTSTRREDGADTDLWPAWPEVDGPLWLPDPEPEGDYRPSFRAARRQPGARRATIGLSRFTTNVVPNAEAVDLMHGRQPNAIEARLHTVTAVRALPAVVPAEQSLARVVGKPLAKADALISDKLAELRDYAREHAGQFDDVGSAEHKQFLKDANALIGRLKQPVKDLVDGITAKETSLGDLAGTWSRRAEAATASFIDNARRELADLGTMLGDAAAMLGDKSLEEARRSAIAALQTAMLQAHQRVGQIEFLADQALANLRHTIADFERQVVGGLRAIGATFARAIVDVRTLYEENSERAEDIDRQFRAEADKALAAVQRLGVGLTGRVSELLGELFGGPAAAAAVTKLPDAATAQLSETLSIAQLTLEEVPPFEFGEPDWAELMGIAAGLLPAEDWLRMRLGTWLPDLAAELSGIKWREEVDKVQAELKALQYAKIQALRDAGDIVALEATLQSARQDIESKAAGWTAGIGMSISAKLTDLQKLGDWPQVAGTFTAALDFKKAAAGQIAKLEAALKLGSVEDVVDALEAAGAGLADSFDQAIKHAEQAIVADIKADLAKIHRDLLAEATPTAFEVTRLLASGIETDTLQCTRDTLGYYYERGKQVLDVTRASALINDLGAASLNALSAMVPFDRLRERLLPQLANIELSDLLPDLAGMKLEYLFPELRLANDRLEEYDWLKVKHGFDKDRLRAWSDVDIDKQFEGDIDLLSLPPVAIALQQARLRAHIRVEVGAQQQRVQDVYASIKANWKLGLGGTAIVTIRGGELVFGNDGRFDFKFEAEDVILADELSFVTDALKALLPQDEGLTIMPLLPAGISATLSLPLPDIGTGAFTLTGVTFHYNLALAVTDGFEIRTGFWLSKPDRPFGLAVLFLGGGGWAGIEIAYRPPDVFSTRVSIGISAGAFAALNFAFARGSAGLLFTAGVEFRRVSGAGGSGSTSVSLGLLIWGEFSILSIASAYLRLTATITYTSQGGMIARGRVEVRIRISFFYTLRLDRAFERLFSGGGGSTLRLTHELTEFETIQFHYQTLDLP
ncbi:hypothetical protein [Novosphingobium resinovorum]|uniref:Uncharacterized protein n=1 Tax=Novosphingobium resinovorum TaxID=158500 RepID=A0A1D8A594_9SPHN|nr:hypothetical protein [Novosphingobium resinovorum]AOR77271.1 hypothetical protein BES08_11320 [Novosphingobium resinovorum]